MPRQLARAAFRRLLRPSAVRTALARALDHAAFAPPRPIDSLPGDRLLVLAPHPDDESIGCGGAIAKSVDRGAAVRVVFLTDGGGGDPEIRRLPEGHPRRRELVETRFREAAVALAALRVHEHVALGAPDGALSPDDRALVAALADEIAGFKPDLVILPFPADRHPDHAAAAGCLIAASERLGEARAFDWAGYEIWSPLPANAVIDIAGTLERKRNAILAYQSQLRTTPYLDGALGLNRYRAVSSGLGESWAEAFHVGTMASLRRLLPARA